MVTGRDPGIVVGMIRRSPFRRRRGQPPTHGGLVLTWVLRTVSLTPSTGARARLAAETRRLTTLFSRSRSSKPARRPDDRAGWADEVSDEEGHFLELN